MYIFIIYRHLNGNTLSIIEDNTRYDLVRYLWMIHVHLKAKRGKLDSSQYYTLRSRVLIHPRGFGC